MPGAILIVDDDADAREIGRRALEAEGYEVLLAGTGEDALGTLAQTGIDLLKTIKIRHAAVDVILVTAYATVASAVEAMSLGAYDYITKPFALGDLRNRVNRLMERRELIVDNRLLEQHVSGCCGCAGVDRAIGNRQVHRGLAHRHGGLMEP